ncbi:MAG: efflux RND transporter periplasmic adaptor subunit [Candidatus Obscuribacterales bacterium]|nr:efflux RND transporter periplasmic adaptor subunit [Candidatus Obscuribacterales bacterium]
MLGSSTLKSTGKTSKKSKWNFKPPFWLLLLVFLAVVGGAGYYYFSSSQHPKDWQKNTVKVERGNIDVRIIATGTIRPVSEVKVSPKNMGLIKQLYVKQGDIVKKGQVIAKMDDSNIIGQIESARGTFMMAEDSYTKAVNGSRPQEVAISKFQEKRARDIVRQAEQNVIRLRAQVDSMKQQTLRDDTLAERQAYLETQGAISDQDRLNSETQMLMTRAQLEAASRELAQAEATTAQNRAELSAAQKQAELTKIGNRQEDIQVAKHAVMQAKGNLSYLLSQQEDMTIRAPFDGVITQKYADSGAIVTPTTSAAATSATTSATSSSIVALAGSLEMVAQVAETDIGKIKIGQAAEIISNAYPEKSFHGIVTQIAPEAVVTQNVTTFEVHTSIDDDKNQKLLSGMNVSARFFGGKLEDALLVPTVCILSKHGKTGVLIPQPDGAPKFKPIKTGPTEGNKTAVMKGLKDGDLVFLGLNKDQLEDQGYSSDKGPGGGRGGPGGGRVGQGGGSAAPIPRSFGR